MVGTGLLQYRFLLKEKGRNKAVVIDVKPLVRPGIFPLEGKRSNCGDNNLACSIKPKTITERVCKTLKIERGYRNIEFSRVIKINKVGARLIRPRWKNEIGAKVRNIKEESDLRLLEANILGQIHRKSLNNRNEYEEAIKDAEEKLIKKAKALTKRMKKIHGHGEFLS